MKKVTENEIKIVFETLRDRHQNPRGEFDKAGRFYLADRELTSVRSPSRAYPYSEMVAGRTRKFVRALAEKHACKTLHALEQVAYS